MKEATVKQIIELAELIRVAGLDKETALNISLRADEEPANRKMVKWMKENKGASAHEICEMSRKILRELYRGNGQPTIPDSRCESKIPRKDSLGETEAEMRSFDISFLIDKRYIDFFTDSNSCFEPIWPEPGTNYHIYPKIMDDFAKATNIALKMAHDIDQYRVTHIPIWAKMREKYFAGEPTVYPREMISYVNEFNNREAVAFLHYCASYKERFCDGAYGSYAKDGLIGMVLLKLTTLPLDLRDC